ncbi:protein ASPARTIC PROTEASE IN GUARD CELL 2-like protein [Carex littledalei]|uniref:Protein ASPARTIC PROTEASE IN GUARD CELL 2-like protein n=1 Tax=Carex littledalei TaxID=544730 RepID=A0A833QBY0_9POAL|nr:protein ASPARTIC PROTEASE IN GUARD CELL 2-like protein [Carex littledalei]
MHTVSLNSLMPADSCSSPQEIKESSGPDDLRLQLVHRYSPCSPLGLDENPTHEQILAQDQSRVDSIHRRAATASNREKAYNPLNSLEIPAHYGASIGTGNYFVSVGFGTPKKYFSVIFDTGSDVTWIQCKPCVSACYSQQDPIFDPTQSSTYRNISCSSNYCDQLDTRGCSGSTCLYAVQYGDGSYTIGYYAQDTLTLTASDVVPNFRFGCGENNDGLFGKAAGLLGLGRDTTSFVSQTIEKYGGVFSYCLPATTTTTGYLSFGTCSVPTNVKYTPLLTNEDTPTFYYLNLIGLSVGGKQLPVSSTVFSNAGTIIDSGTVITRLPSDAYSALRTAFRQAMSQYKTAPALSILDTCYDFTGHSSVTIPVISFIFSGSTVTLDAAGVFYTNTISQVCLAFTGNSDPSDFTIIGNVQQRKLNVVYDVSRKLVGFGPGTC